MVYTPKNEKGERLKFEDKDVKFLSDYKEGRYAGVKGHVEIKGKKYQAIGIPCNLEGCMCDEMIKEVRK